MTSKEIGMNAHTKSLDSHDYDHARSLAEFNEWMDQAISAALDAAIAAERERAAQICDAYTAELIARSLPRDPERDKDGNYFDAVCWHVNVIQSRIRSD